MALATSTAMTSEERRMAEREVRLKRLGRQILVAREGQLSQADLGRRLGAFLEAPVPQTTISRWEQGQVDLGIEQIRALEVVLGVEKGMLLAASGYIDFTPTPVADIENLILTDPHMHPSQRQSVLSIYRTFVETSQHLFERDQAREA